MPSTKILEDKLIAAKTEYEETLKILSSLQNEIRNTEARAWGLQGAIQVLQSTLEETKNTTTENSIETPQEEKTPVRLATVRRGK